MDGVLGVMNRTEIVLDDQIEELIRQREQARKQKNFAEADSIRTRLDELGIILEDTPQGTAWKRKLS